MVTQQVMKGFWWLAFKQLPKMYVCCWLNGWCVFRRHGEINLYMSVCTVQCPLVPTKQQHVFNLLVQGIDNAFRRYEMLYKMSFISSYILHGNCVYMCMLNVRICVCVCIRLWKESKVLENPRVYSWISFSSI